MLLEDIELGIGTTDELLLTTTGRVSGKQRTVPVWYVRRATTIDLLPVGGRQNQWFKNAIATPDVSVAARGVTFRAAVRFVDDPDQVESVLAQFRDKYGPDEVLKYYPGADVVVEAQLTGRVDHHDVDTQERTPS